MKFRDSETGEFKELYAKAADTLPVGTVVDFDGVEIPAGWEEIESDEVVLFESENGDNATTLTLTETLANYKEVEVVFGNAGLIKSVKAPKGFAIELSLSRAGYFDNSYYGVRQISSDISFNGTTATKPVGYTLTFKTDNTITFNDKLNDIYIYKIIGYK